MLTERHLIAGLDAVARAYSPDWEPQASFGDAHRGAALLSVWLMLRDGHAEPGLDEILWPLVDDAWMAKPLFAPMPPGTASARELDAFLEALAATYGTPIHAGHGVIFASLALRAFALMPSARTSARLAGLRAMATSLAPPERPSIAAAAHPLDADALADEALRAFADSARAYADHGQGFTGHVLTFGCAVLDLHDLGYADLARLAAVGYRAYIADCRKGPDGPNKQAKRPPRAYAPLDPRRAAFWTSRARGYLEREIGHFGKYAYAFAALTARATNPTAVAAASHALFEVME